MMRAMIGIGLLLVTPSLVGADYKVVRKQADNSVVAFGPNTDQYQPIVKSGEALTVELSQPILPAQPDVKGFRAWLHANVSWSLRNNIYKAYPMFLRDLGDSNWTDFQAGVIQAKADVTLTSGQWTALKNAVSTYKIPVTLP